MKNSILSLFVAVAITSATYAQVQIDKPIQLTGGAGQRSITNLETPVNGTDAVNKDYVDAKVAAGGGGVQWSNFQRFIAGGTFTVPTGVTQIKVQVWGGGGGGGGSNSGDSYGGGGGGGGGFAEGIYTVTSGSTHAVVVGTGGSGGAASTAGSAGGTSSFGAGPLIQATGGAGGRYAPNMGGQGGMGSGGYINTTLGAGGNATNSSTGFVSYSGSNSGGSGGGARGGGGGGGNGGGNGGFVSNPGSSATPNTGAGGGGGGYASQVGGSGADGQVIIFW